MTPGARSFLAARVSLLRHWPFRRGRRRFARALRLGAQQIPAAQVTTAGPLGLKFRVFPDDVYFDIFFFREYERFETAYMLGQLQGGAGMVDVGANFGWFALHAATAVGRTGWIRAFEPQQEVRAELLANLNLNTPASGVSFESSGTAIGRHSGSLTIGRSIAASHAYASAFADRGRSDCRLTEVPMESLDSLSQNGALPGVPDFIKCDVEGGELEVLAGAERLCSTVRRPTWLLEINRTAASRAGWQPEDMVGVLSSWGYEEFWFVSHAVRPRRVRVGEMTRLPDNGNIIARSR